LKRIARLPIAIISFSW